MPLFSFLILLINSEALLTVGNTLFIKADARIDDTGLRCVVESLQSLEDVLATIDTKFMVTIHDKATIPTIQSRLKERGREVLLSYKLPSGELVRFAMKSKIYLEDTDAEELRKISGLDITEI
jgi:hypothetical protein